MLLDDSNYTTWKSYIKNRLEDEGLWGITVGTDTIPKDQNQTDAMEAFKKNSRLAFYLLIKSIDDSVIFSVSALDFENNPSELWKVLQTKYQPSDLVSKFEAFKRLRSLEFNGSDPHQFIDSIRDRFAELDQAGFTFDESTWMVLFLSQLPTQVANSVLGKDSPDTDTAGITSCEYLFEKLRTLPIQQTNRTHHRNSQDFHSNSADTHLSGPTRTVLSCTKCNRKGHNINHCWIAHPELNPYNNTKNFGSSQTGASSIDSPNARSFNGNNDKYDNKTKNYKSNGWIPREGRAPHQKDGWTPHHKDSNHSDLSTNGDWKNSYQQRNKENNHPHNNGYNNEHTRNPNNDNNNNDLFRKTFKKKFQGGQGEDWRIQSSKWSPKEDEGTETPMIKDNGGWGNSSSNNTNNTGVEEEPTGWNTNQDSSGWTTKENLIENSKVATSGWTENAADFEISDTPPNQWSV